MRIPFLLVSATLVSASAQANLCDPEWLAGAGGGAVQAQIRAGADVNEACNMNRNRPLHQAIITPAVDLDVFQALVGAGADTQARNIEGPTPADYAVSRSQRAGATFPDGSGAYRGNGAARRGAPPAVAASTAVTTKWRHMCRRPQEATIAVGGGPTASIDLWELVLQFGE